MTLSSPNRSRRVRPEVAAIPLVLIAMFAVRAQTLASGVGGDEFSLLVMANAIREGGFPYAHFWDVRPPLAYFWGLPSACLDDAVDAVVTLRLLALFAQSVAAWLFFCLFRQQLGSLPAALGTAALLASVNMAELHDRALPNHFAMAVSIGAFASAVEGIRRNLRAMYLVSAVLAGLLPWMMVHAALGALAVALLAIPGAWSTNRRWAWSWLAVAGIPTIAVIGAYALWGPLDALMRTVLVAPIDFVAEGVARGAFSFPDLDLADASVSLELLHYVLLLVSGIVLLPGMVRRAAAESPLRQSPYLVLPSMLPWILMASIKGGATEYWIDAAPAAALLVAVAVHRAFSLRAWAAFDRFRYMRPPVLRGFVAVYLGLVLVLLTRPGDDASDDASDQSLPPAYCEAAAWWIEQLDGQRTVLDTTALCGYWMLQSNASLHPPFTFADNWFRQFGVRWMGKALAGNGSESAAAVRLAEAIGPASTAGILLADARLCDEIRERRWGDLFFQEWELAWRRNIDGFRPEKRFSTLAVFVRRDVFLGGREEWLEAEACGDGCVRAKEDR